ncbi:glutamate decarboxylase [Saccharopolyspora antimicrobica]|uniref:Glutamate decarboxylase n=1 Tax=Saccharopolyspora antimicrobica TaxID=455193 RepID=A0A1I5KSI3_9PSEU|nr:glutamate decarboxylase [Saccharopolyspora antimicrobica]RKT89142.1 glutamate decarboxylase [Saccharopolyspora antimicrobica]SFO87893.1 glutamate decarboxylase [Saccharopolyspora antimicrobica]
MSALLEGSVALPQSSPECCDAFPQSGLDAMTASEVVRQRLRGDCAPARNLATFLTTTIDPEAQRLFHDYANCNLVDREQYPAVDELVHDCVRMIGSLWHGEACRVVGSATTGSSEAALLAGAALLRRWQARAGTEGLRPNLVMGASAHACWQKFCRHWGVEARIAPAAPDRLGLDGPSAAGLCDEETIGVIAVLGTTVDGRYEPVREIAGALDALEQRRGIDVPVHVDAASGGFIAPFLDSELRWDFQLSRVVSINASGHKSGLVLPGLGWLLWRDASWRRPELGQRVNYLGGDETHYELSFSRPAAPVVLQYYNFVRFGFTGFRAVHERCRSLARQLADRLRGIGRLRLLSDGSELPVIALTAGPELKLEQLAMHLANRGWAVPVYALPGELSDIEVMRVVVRSDLSAAEVERFSAAVEEFATAAN